MTAHLPIQTSTTIARHNSARQFPTDENAANGSV